MIEIIYIIIGIILLICLGWTVNTIYIILRVHKRYGNIEVGNGTITFLIENLDKSKIQRVIENETK